MHGLQKLPWVKSVLSGNYLVTHVQCNICTMVSSLEKLMTPKFNSLYKHVGRKKDISPMLNVPKGTLCYAKDYQNVKKIVTCF
jgi:Ran GTPase-activating protein (RanGAP) involved in mRNA processing and transport